MRGCGCAAKWGSAQFQLCSRTVCGTATVVMPHNLLLPAYARSLHEKLSNPSTAAAFIRNGIASDVAALIQWDKLRLVPGSFINEDRRHLEADLLFCAPFAENEVFLYLLLVQPVLQMVSSDFVGRKEDSATLLREGGRVFFPIPVLLVGCES